MERNERSTDLKQTRVALVVQCAVAKPEIQNVLSIRNIKGSPSV